MPERNVAVREDARQTKINVLTAGCLQKADITSASLNCIHKSSQVISSVGMIQR